MPDLHGRRSIRLPGFDYRSNRWYFVTLCAHKRMLLPRLRCGALNGPFGRLAGTRIVLTATGGMIESEWGLLAQRFPWVVRGPAVVMPDHFHALIGVDGSHRDAMEPDLGPRGTRRGSLACAIQALKSTTTHRWRCLLRDGDGPVPGHPLWQRNYWEAIIRDSRHLDAVTRYIEGNPRRLAQRRTGVRG